MSLLINSTVGRWESEGAGIKRNMMACVRCRQFKQKCIWDEPGRPCKGCAKGNYQCNFQTRTSTRPKKTQSKTEPILVCPQDAVPDTLQDFLVGLAHLNLTGKISNISPVMKAHGGYSDIFTGYCSIVQPNGKVAIKRLRVHIMGDKKFQKRLSKELHIWCKLDHPYVLPLLGFFFEDNDYPLLVSVWMENGTVLKYLESHPDCDLQQMILGIAKGIEYLHDNDIVHSDIKPENILVSSSGKPRICDFGISRMLSASKDFNIGSSTTGGLKGTIRYTAIELFNVTDEELSTYSKASDVWVFGMTVLVMLTKEPPYSHLSSEIQVIVAIMHGGLPPVPEDHEVWPKLYQSLWKLCVSCWDISLFRRPTMSDICSTLESLSNHAEDGGEEVIDHNTSCPPIEWVLWSHSGQ